MKTKLNIIESQDQNIVDTPFKNKKKIRVSMEPIPENLSCENDINCVSHEKSSTTLPIRNKTKLELVSIIKPTSNIIRLNRSKNPIKEQIIDVVSSPAFNDLKGNVIIRKIKKPTSAEKINLSATTIPKKHKHVDRNNSLIPALETNNESLRSEIITQTPSMLDKQKKKEEHKREKEEHKLEKEKHKREKEEHKKEKEARHKKNKEEKHKKEAEKHKDKADKHKKDEDKHKKDEDKHKKDADKHKDKDKSNLIRRSISITPIKTVIKTNRPIQEIPVYDLPEFNGSALANECLEILKSNDPNSQLSKEELIERIEYQLDNIVKNKTRYTEDDYKLKVHAVEKILSKLRVGLVDENVREMKTINTKIDKSVKKIPEKQFIRKIDLKGERDNNDPTFHLHINSRKHFKGMTYIKDIPPEIQKNDPSKKRGGFGNVPIPANLLNQINFR